MSIHSLPAGVICSVYQFLGLSESLEPLSKKFYAISCSCLVWREFCRQENIHLQNPFLEKALKDLLLLKTKNFKDIFRLARYVRARELEDFQQENTRKMLIRRDTKKLERLPYNFGGIKNLVHVDLRNNSLSCLPKSFGDLHTVAYLNLSNNRFQGCFPVEVSPLRSLERLEASGNAFTHLNDSFSQLVSLERCTFSNNAFTQLCPSFKKLRKLRYLDLSQNPNFAILPKGFFAMRLEEFTLTVLNLSSTNQDRLRKMRAFKDNGMLPGPPILVSQTSVTHFINSQERIEEWGIDRSLTQSPTPDSKEQKQDSKEQKAEGSTTLARAPSNISRKKRKTNKQINKLQFTFS